jgi:hypothetical protein
MRLWFSGPRLLGGLIRPGISLGLRDLKSKQADVGVDGLLSILRRGDGSMSIFSKAQDDEEFTPDMSVPRAFGFRNMADAVQIHEGALIRLGAKDGRIAGKSLGQVVAAVRAEAQIALALFIVLLLLVGIVVLFGH